MNASGSVMIRKYKIVNRLNLSIIHTNAAILKKKIGDDRSYTHCRYNSTGRPRPSTKYPWTNTVETLSVDDDDDAENNGLHQLPNIAISCPLRY